MSCGNTLISLNLLCTSEIIFPGRTNIKIFFYTWSEHSLFEVYLSMQVPPVEVTIAFMSMDRNVLSSQQVSNGCKVKFKILCNCSLITFFNLHCHTVNHIFHLIMSLLGKHWRQLLVLHTAIFETEQFRLYNLSVFFKHLRASIHRYVFSKYLH